MVHIEKLDATNFGQSGAGPAQAQRTRRKKRSHEHCRRVMSSRDKSPVIPSTVSPLNHILMSCVCLVFAPGSRRGCRARACAYSVLADHADWAESTHSIPFHSIPGRRSQGTHVEVAELRRAHGELKGSRRRRRVGEERKQVVSVGSATFSCWGGLPSQCVP